MREMQAKKRLIVSFCHVNTVIIAGAVWRKYAKSRKKNAVFASRK
jgi:hypothetical protein